MYGVLIGSWEIDATLMQIVMIDLEKVESHSTGDEMTKYAEITPRAPFAEASTRGKPERIVNQQPGLQFPSDRLC